MGAYPLVDFQMWELIQFNEFVNHQISKNLIVEEVEIMLDETKMFRYARRRNVETRMKAFIRQETGIKDPGLLERVLYAFGLLEAIAQVGMQFIFKGGSCLMLMTDQPRRLSTDIDILVEPGTDIDKYIMEAAKIFPFKTYGEQKRIGRNQIEKRHFKFVYDSPLRNTEFYILLDVVFTESPYLVTIEKGIENGTGSCRNYPTRC